MLLVVHLSNLHGKQLLMKLTFEKQQTYANRLLGFILVNYTPTRCVNLCRPVFRRVGISLQRQVDSRRGKTRHVALKLWSCLTFNERYQNVKIKASTLPADRGKLTFSVDGFCCHYNTVFGEKGCFYHFFPCQEVRPSLTEDDIKRGGRKKELDKLVEVTHEKKSSLSLKSETVSGGDCTRQLIKLNNMSENISFTDVHWQITNS